MLTNASVRTCVLLLALSASACLTPPVVLAGESLPLDEALARLPAPNEAVELTAIDGATLRGAYVPAGEGAAVVLHLFGATDSFGSRKFSQRPHVSQLRDLGLASLLVDYRGVGLSEGERSAEHLGDDAWTLWQEALRRAGGDPARVGIRATSLGTMATALLLERGARPGAITLIAPVLPETVVRRYARFEHGRIVSWIARMLFDAVAEVDMLAQLRGYEGPLLFCGSEADEFLSDDERAELQRLAAAENVQWFGPVGGHYRSSVGGRVLQGPERSFWPEALPPRAPARTLDDLWRERPDLATAFGDQPEASARLARLLELKRYGDIDVLAAAAFAFPEPTLAREFLWSLEQRPYPELGFEELREVLAWDDPSGAIPYDLVLAISRPLDEAERLGLPRFRMESSFLALCAQNVDLGKAQLTSTYHFGSEDAHFVLDYTALWSELLARGIPAADARRVFLRVALRVERIPERHRPGGAGLHGLQVYESDEWRPLAAGPATLTLRGNDGKTKTWTFTTRAADDP